MLIEFVTSFMFDDSQRGFILPAEKPTIRILIYTDDPHGITKGNELFGLSTMIAHLKSHEPAFATFSVELISRNADAQNHAGNRLTPALLQQFDEVWFFGIHQADRPRFSLGVVRGGPHSELEPEEIVALRDWMKSGGVLMSGDHASPLAEDVQPDEPCPGGGAQDAFLGLGRAIGHSVPRAGRLRKWEGTPTACKENSFNTQSPVAGFDVDSLILQADGLPQQLILQSFDPNGKPTTTGGYAHPLFFYKGGALIQVFPDHAHEGAVIPPDNLNDKEVWPESQAEPPVQPEPYVVARGVDKRNSELLDLVSAYNGDCADVGRIVATSTWHQFLNINLLNLPPSSPVGSAADQIGQFYANLALWLSPRSTRLAMARTMIDRLARQPLTLEEIGRSAQDIGRAAYSLLSALASPCEIHELLQTMLPDKHRVRFETVYFPERSFTLSPFPSKELLLGSAIASFYEEAIRVETSDAQDLRPASLAQIQSTGFDRALTEQSKRINKVLADARDIFKN